MKHRSDRLWIAVAVAALSASAVSAQPPATLNVEVNRPKAAVSPTPYGLMTEEIDDSYDGGLQGAGAASQPTRMVPGNSTLKINGERLPYVVPPYSIQGLEVTLKQEEPCSRRGLPPD